MCIMARPKYATQSCTYSHRFIVRCEHRVLLYLFSMFQNRGRLRANCKKTIVRWTSPFSLQCQPIKVGQYMVVHVPCIYRYIQYDIGMYVHPPPPPLRTMSLLSILASKHPRHKAALSSLGLSSYIKSRDRHPETMRTSNPLIRTSFRFTMYIYTT